MQELNDEQLEQVTGGDYTGNVASTGITTEGEAQGTQFAKFVSKGRSVSIQGPDGAVCSFTVGGAVAFAY
jgi:bacteriocin-like protein